jgi:hypothetical protein
VTPAITYWVLCYPSGKLMGLLPRLHPFDDGTPFEADNPINGYFFRDKTSALEVEQRHPALDLQAFQATLVVTDPGTL